MSSAGPPICWLPHGRNVVRRLSRRNPGPCPLKPPLHPRMREARTVVNAQVGCLSLTPFRGYADSRKQVVGSWHSSEANDATLRGNYCCSGAIINTQFRKDMFHVALD